MSAQLEIGGEMKLVTVYFIVSYAGGLTHELSRDIQTLFGLEWSYSHGVSLKK